MYCLSLLLEKTRFWTNWLMLDHVSDIARNRKFAPAYPGWEGGGRGFRRAPILISAGSSFSFGLESSASKSILSWESCSIRVATASLRKLTILTALLIISQNCFHDWFGLSITMHTKFQNFLIYQPACISVYQRVYWSSFGSLCLLLNNLYNYNCLLQILSSSLAHCQNRLTFSTEIRPCKYWVVKLSVIQHQHYDNRTQISDIATKARRSTQSWVSSIHLTSTLMLSFCSIGFPA